MWKVGANARGFSITAVGWMLFSAAVWLLLATVADAANQVGKLVGGKPVTISVRMDAEAERVAQDSKSLMRLRLLVTLRPNKAAAQQTVRIFGAHPDAGSKTAPDAPRWIGDVAFFPRVNEQAEWQFAFDVTELVRSEVAARRLDAKAGLPVTLFIVSESVPVSPEAAVDVVKVELKSS